jgi:phosphohistidine phosphatase
MKYLTVLRHAKSSWGQPGLNDHDRPLNERGQLAAPAIAAFLKRTYFGGSGDAPLMMPPDGMISSTAVRAYSTAEYARVTLGLAPEAMRLDSRLYLAQSTTILEVVRGCDESLKHLIIVGHNPGLHEFCDRLLARTSIPRMPTGAAVIMGLPHEYWGMADLQEAQLIAYVTPKALERRFPQEFHGISKQTGEDD